MRKRIAISLFLLFGIFGVGAVITAVNIATTTSLFNSLIKLHQIETLRHDLVQKVLKVNSDLYSINTPMAQDLELIVRNVEDLDQSAGECLSCHHEPAVERQLTQMQVDLQDFKEALSFYITAKASKQRLQEMRSEASFAGNRLLTETEQMAFEATGKVQVLTDKARVQLARVKVLLTYVLLTSALFGILVALHLTRSVTAPVSLLVKATRKIAAGELGYTLTHPLTGEFGELSDHFNSMSRSLKSGYEKLKQEIADRREAEEALRQSQERYALAARGANDGLWDWDLARQTIFFSIRWKSMLGFKEEEIGNDPQEWLQLVHPDDRPQLEEKIASHLEGRTPHIEYEYRILGRDTVYRWVLVRGIAELDADGKPYRVAGSQTDITDRKRAEEQLIHDAFRALFLDRLEHVLHVAQRRRSYLFAVIFLDLDRFKFINDSLGHSIGDQVLISVAQRLASYLRPNDTVARLGGDEFAILLDDIKDTADAVSVAERIQRELPLPLHLEGHEIFTSASIGIAIGSHHYRRYDELLRDADLAMYQAKANGKARYELFDSIMYARSKQHLKMETALRRALERDEFRLVFQPIVGTRPRSIRGFEALVRWEHPELGLLSPSEFISVAEETGLISGIGQWVVREACRRFSVWQQRWPADPPLTLNVNLSGKEFSAPFIAHIREVLAEFPLLPGSLKLEIKEGTIMKSPESLAQMLLQLKELGVGLNIDHFGTGYSSLSYLHHFPIDSLKIDRSFVQQIHRNKENFEVVRTIIALARNLKMTVVAEGIENEKELRAILELGCDFAQGFYLHKPMAAMDIERLLAGETQVESAGIASKGVSG